MTLQAANGAECDVCKRRVNFDRKRSEFELARLVSYGWTIPSSKFDFTSPAYCPDHAKVESDDGSGYQKTVQNDG